MWPRGRVFFLPPTPCQTNSPRAMNADLLAARRSPRENEPSWRVKHKRKRNHSQREKHHRRTLARDERTQLLCRKLLRPWRSLHSRRNQKKRPGSARLGSVVAKPCTRCCSESGKKF